MRGLALMLCLVALIPPRVASGQDTVSSEDRERARAYSRSGRQLQGEGRYAEAIVDYQRAYDLAPLPDLLFNIAQCHRLAGNDFQAIQFYRRYIAAAPDGRGAEESRAHIVALTPRLERIREPDWTYQPPPPPPPPDPTLVWIHRGSVAAIAVGGVALGTSLVLGVRAADIEDRVENTEHFDPGLSGIQDRGESYHRWMLITGISGGALVATGLVGLWLTRELESSADGQTLSMRPRLGPGTLGVDVGLRF